MGILDRFNRNTRRPVARAQKSSSPVVLLYDGEEITPIRAKGDFEPHSSLANWLRPGGSTFRELGNGDDGYAQAYMTCTWAFRAINVRVQKVAEVMRRGRVVDRQTGAEVKDHPLYRALELAYIHYQQDVFESWEFQKSLFGAAYVEKVSAYPQGLPMLGMPSTLRVLDTMGVSPMVVRGKVQKYTYEDDAGKVDFEPDEIAADLLRHPLDSFRGYSLLAAAMDAINIDRSVIIFTRKHLKNNARPGLIFVPKQGNLTETDIDLIKTTLSEDVKGPDNAGKPLLMPVAFDVITAAPPPMEDLNVLTEEQKRRICAVIGVPVALVDYVDMAYQLSPEQKSTFYELTIVPGAEKIARVVDTQLRPFFDPRGNTRFELPVDEIYANLRDPQSKVEVANAKLQSGAVTINEYRQEVGLAAVDGGDQFALPSGVVLVPREQLGAANTIIAQQRPPAVAPMMAATTLPANTAAPLLPSKAQTDAEQELATWVRFALRHGAKKAGRFVSKSLDEATAQSIRQALQALPDQTDKAAIKAIFRSAQSKKKDDADAVTPEEFLAYWRAFDELREQIGDTWLDSYMSRVHDRLRKRLRPGGLVQADVDAALNEFDEELVADWIGTLDDPGPLLKLMLAGMGVGNEALQRAVALKPPTKAITIDWNLQSQEAIVFSRRYAFDLISRVNQTTRNAVAASLNDWLLAGEPLDSLTGRLNTIFNDPRRAELIAQTESTRAYHEGARQRWQQAGVRRAKFQTVRDVHVCPICAPLHNTVVDLDAGWEDGKGGRKRPPMHPGCRCFARPVLDD